MDEKTRVLISLGASVASNCIPCFEHFFEKGHHVKLTTEEIKETVEVAMQVKNGAQITLKNVVNELTDGEKPKSQSCCDQPDASCCG